MTTDHSDISDGELRSHRASALKERIYVTFTILAVLIALRTHDDHPSATAAIGTLVVAVAATVVAVYIADLLSHMIIHSRLPELAEHRRIILSTLGASTVALPPLACLAPAAFGLYEVGIGLSAGTAISVATVAAIGFLAVRKLALPRRQRFVILAAELVLVILVIALELLSHR